MEPGRNEGDEIRIADFLLARIDEDEATAAEGRELMECHAKRRIVEYLAMDGNDSVSDTRSPGILGDAATMVLRWLAMPYQTHPQFSPAWSVE